MPTHTPARVPSLHRILVPTDLSARADAGFVHAVRLALNTRSFVHMFHVQDDPTEHIDWSQRPTVRQLLESWGVLPPNASVEDYEALGLQVKLGAATSYRTVPGIIDTVDRERVDLVILPTEARWGVERLLYPSVAESVARHTGIMSLLIPDNAKGLVDPVSGEVSLKRLLLPLSSTDSPELALEAAKQFATWMGVQAEIVLLHMGTRDSMPDVRLGNGGQWIWTTDVRGGPVVQGIIDAAKEHHIDLIVMTTQGHDSVADSLIGSHAERVLRSQVAPLLTVPLRMR